MIGMLTFHWADDYGALLQAYALKRRLEALGGETEVIPYAPVKLTGRYWFCPVYARAEGGAIRYKPWGYLLRRNLALGMDFWVRRRRMARFRRRYLTAKPPVRRADKISLAGYEAVFVGSDQVWNPDITVDLDDAYIGNVPGREGCRWVSYAASASGHAFTRDEEEKLRRFVGGGFAGISLRERGDARRLEELLGRKVWDVLDPALLVEASHWRELAEPPKDGEGEEYILLYLTEPHEGLMRCARALSARLGKKLVALGQPRHLGWAGDVNVRAGIGPEEFVGYLDRAGWVLTNSFHATAFSVLFEKPFLTFRHRQRGIRLEELLEGLGLGSLLVEEAGEDEALSLWEKADWAEARRRLEEKRAASQRFIRDCLEGAGAEGKGGL